MFSGKNRIIVTIKSAIISLVFIPCDIRTIKWFLAVKEKTSLVFLLTAKNLKGSLVFPVVSILF